MIRFGEEFSLEEAQRRNLLEVEDYIKELDLILSLDNKAFYNEFVQSCVQDAIVEVKDLLKRINEISKAITHWRSLGKDTSKIYKEW